MKQMSQAKIQAVLRIGKLNIDVDQRIVRDEHNTPFLLTKPPEGLKAAQAGTKQHHFAMKLALCWENKLTQMRGLMMWKVKFSEILVLYHVWDVNLYKWLLHISGV